MKHKGWDIFLVGSWQFLVISCWLLVVRCKLSDTDEECDVIFYSGLNNLDFYEDLFVLNVSRETFNFV